MLTQLSGLDASFLYLETGRSYGHVNSVLLFDRPDDPDFEPFTEYYHRMARIAGEFVPLRRRLVEVPFGLDHPYWAEDPDFDLDFHVRHIAVPPPGDRAALDTLVARLISRPLDRSKPLWEAYVIEGLEDDQFAVFTKIHHSTVDGAAGALLTQQVFAAAETIDLRDEPPPATAAPPLPSATQVFGRAVFDLARRPERLWKFQRRFAGQLFRVGVSSTDRRDLAQTLHSVPPTPFNAPISANRRFTWRSVSLADVKAIKNALGVTVNDVVMAMVAGALRTYLEEHEALPEVPLVAMIPVSIRTGEEEDPWTNRVSSIFADIPTDRSERADRIAAISETMLEGKHRFDLLPADLIVDAASLAGTARPAGGPHHHQPPGRRVDAATGQRGDQQCARPSGAARTGRCPGEPLRAGVDGGRRPGAQHHGAELLRHARHRARRLPRARAGPRPSRRSASRGVRGPGRAGRSRHHRRHVTPSSMRTDRAEWSNRPLGSTSSGWRDDLVARLTAAGDPERAAKQQAYMKSTMPYHGVPAPVVRKLTTALVAAHPFPDRDAWLTGVATLWRDATHREQRYVATDLAYRSTYRRWLDPDAFWLVEEMIVTGAWWDHVDELASNHVGHLLAHHREVIRPILWRWATDDDRWRRRTAIICQLKFRDRTDLELLFHAIESSIDEKDFFLRKAIGWSLRQYAKTAPDTVVGFVDRHVERLSGLSRREALKNLTTSTGHS
ncbi:MAG: wax ester/triacylglycerol synthase family O-acyltransferase [Acidimicrobiales bacterium]